MKDSEKCKCFELLLAAGSAAETWFEGLPDDVRTDWKKLSDAFVDEWYQEAAPPLSDAEALEYICQTMPKLEDLLKFDNPPNSRPVPCHIQWARILHSQARAEGYSDSLAEQVRARLPRPLCNQLPKATSWKALLEACQNVDTSKLRELVNDTVEDAAKQKALEERVASVEGKHAASSAIANKNPLPKTTTSVDDLAQQMNALAIRTTYPVSSHPPIYLYPPYPGWAAPSPTLLPRMPPAQPAAVRRPERPPQQRLEVLTKNALPPPPLTDEGRAKYTAQVEDWHRAHPGLEPDEERPYLLTPGTLPVARRECYTCGMPRHIGSACASPPVPKLESRWRAIVGHIRATNRPGQQFAPAGVQFVSSDSPPPQPYPAMPYPYPPGHAYPGTYGGWQSPSTNVQYGQAEDQGNV
ncbi:hypothetical protein BV20DRAFT_1053937 [Pilatotrama ljubarskyi]|nr:hypothetical protein BV20DRAFT_1053937 [Pilatotrama ljubarskyi]